MGGQPNSQAAAAIAAAAAAIPPGQVELNGDRYMPRADGVMVPLEGVKEMDLVRDQLVRRLMAQADALAATLAAFKARGFDDVDALQALLAEKYKAKVGGEKGNLTLYSYDGLLKVQVQSADLIKFGPELQTAKALIDECTGEWVEGARVELKAIVMDAFRHDKEGNLNKGRLLALRRYEISDPRWGRAMEAIADSIEVIGSKRYLRFARRPTLKGAWREVSLNIASAGAPAEAAP